MPVGVYFSTEGVFLVGLFVFLWFWFVVLVLFFFFKFDTPLTPKSRFLGVQSQRHRYSCVASRKGHIRFKMPECLTTKKNSPSFPSVWERDGGAGTSFGEGKKILKNVYEGSIFA